MAQTIHNRRVTCDSCTRYNDLYDGMMTCRDCMRDCCDFCAEEGTVIDWDGATDASADQGTVICKRCAAAEAAQ